MEVVRRLWSTLIGCAPHVSWHYVYRPRHHAGELVRYVQVGPLCARFREPCRLVSSAPPGSSFAVAPGSPEICSGKTSPAGEGHVLSFRLWLVVKAAILAFAIVIAVVGNRYASFKPTQHYRLDELENENIIEYINKTFQIIQTFNFTGAIQSPRYISMYSCTYINVSCMAAAIRYMI